MIDLDECSCATPCAVCEDCFLSKCECECEEEAGLKILPEEDEDDDNDEGGHDAEEPEDETSDTFDARSLGINMSSEEKMTEY